MAQSSSSARHVFLLKAICQRNYFENEMRSVVFVCRCYIPVQPLCSLNVLSCVMTPPGEPSRRVGSAG